MKDIMTSPAGIAVMCVVGAVLVAWYLYDAFSPDKPVPMLWQRIRDARKKGRWK